MRLKLSSAPLRKIVYLVSMARPLYDNGSVAEEFPWEAQLYGQLKECLAVPRQLMSHSPLE